MRKQACKKASNSLLIVAQGSQTQRNVRSSMSDPDMFLNYTPTSAVSDVGKQAQLGGRHAFPDSVHIPEGVHKAIKRVKFDFASALHMTCLPLPSALASWLIIHDRWS